MENEYHQTIKMKEKCLKNHFRQTKKSSKTKLIEGILSKGEKIMGCPVIATDEGKASTNRQEKKITNEYA